MPNGDFCVLLSARTSALTLQKKYRLANDQREKVTLVYVGT